MDCECADPVNTDLDQMLMVNVPFAGYMRSRSRLLLLASRHSPASPHQGQRGATAGGNMALRSEGWVSQPSKGPAIAIPKAVLTFSAYSFIRPGLYSSLATQPTTSDPLRAPQVSPSCVWRAAQHHGRHAVVDITSSFPLFPSLPLAAIAPHSAGGLSKSQGSSFNVSQGRPQGHEGHDHESWASDASNGACPPLQTPARRASYRERPGASKTSILVTVTVMYNIRAFCISRTTLLHSPLRPLLKERGSLEELEQSHSFASMSLRAECMRRWLTLLPTTLSSPRGHSVPE